MGWDVRVCGGHGEVREYVVGLRSVVGESDLGVDGLVGRAEVERARDVEVAVYPRVRGDDSRVLRLDRLCKHMRARNQSVSSGADADRR